MFKYATLNNISKAGTDRFDGNFEHTDNVDEAQGILVRSAKMHDMTFSDNLLAIARAGAGVNNIPLDRCAQQGIVVFNTPGANANGVKELVIAGMLLASRDIVEGVDWVRSQWNNPDIVADVEKQKKQFAGTEIEGKKLGIIGLGAIGVRVANAAVYLGMDVYGYDPYVGVDNAWHLSRKVTHVTDINEIYRNCDIITIHVPAMDSTKGYISREAIDMMKQGVIVLNMARDVLVDEKAMIAAIDAGKVRRYVSDFPNPTVAGHRGCITTPHLGASTEESETNCAIMAADEMQDYLENGNIRHSVNLPDCDAGVCQYASRLTVIHRNVASMISRFSTIMGDAKINIAEMTNKSRGEYAYTIMDLDSAPTEDVIAKLQSAEGVIRVRLVK
ncbi:MAG TPA: 3-phosphoglycerate dehydrogenase [Lachnospiraceae bacterium]|jgi:D-3-phosphoglycerate dehydrogenase|nr:3-phosphoglycerate dehydrogenase [Lachnospiraceae bacterium]